MQPYLDFSVPQTYTDVIDVESLASHTSAQHQQQHQQHQHLQHLYPSQSSAAPVLESSKPAFYPPTLPSQMSCEIKPRLTKEQHDVLEAHYQQQNKPPTDTKRAFAASLNVSMDKVNNWFQNRRAKAKHDAKKQADTFNNPQFAPASDVQPAAFTSEHSVSPAMVVPSEYHASVDQWAAAQQTGIGEVNGSIYRPQQQSQPHILPTQLPDGDAQYFTYAGAHQNPATVELFDSPIDLNRRTLTQEQFDAFARNGGMVDGSGAFEDFHTGFSGNDDLLKQIFPDLLAGDCKFHGDPAYQFNSCASISSYDSGILSATSDQSMFGLSQPPPPTTTTTTTHMQDAGSISASSSEYAESRTSSLSFQDESSYVMPQGTMVAPAPPPPHSTSQWQPGQSIPVDINALNEQFRQAAQSAQDRQISPLHHTFEQPSPWPSEDAFVRRGSQTTLLTQSMSNVGIDTPQPTQTATFKSPAPPSNIAARRRRPRPAALGTEALRSQSYTDGAGPFSAGPVPQPSSATTAPNLRRIRSSNVIGAVAQGRVMKSIPGSTQRSPLSWTFTESLQSPSIAQHMSQSQESLAPPTPRSPGEWGTETNRHATFPLWQPSAEQVNRQPPILEADVENSFSQSTSDFSVAAPLNAPVGSPPHTPIHVQQQYFLQQQHLIQQQQQQQQQQNLHRTMLENTPPQSAPASQQSFPSNIFAALPTQSQQTQSSMAPPVHIPKLASQPQQQYMNVIMPKPSTTQANVVFAPQQHQQQQLASNVSSPPLRTPVQFANGVPVVNTEGNFKMTFSPQACFTQQTQQPQQQRSAQLAARRNSHNNVMSTTNSLSTPQTTYQFVTTSGSTASYPLVSQHIQPKASGQGPTELMVREYSPPEEIKRNATPRKGGEAMGPKSYTFANQTPEHFEKAKKSDKAHSNASTSPTSSEESVNGSSIAS